MAAIGIAVYQLGKIVTEHDVRSDRLIVGAIGRLEHISHLLLIFVGCTSECFFNDVVAFEQFAGNIQARIDFLAQFRAPTLEVVWPGEHLVLCRPDGVNAEGARPLVIVPFGHAGFLPAIFTPLAVLDDSSDEIVPLTEDISRDIDTVAFLALKCVSTAINHRLHILDHHTAWRLVKQTEIGINHRFLAFHKIEERFRIAI